MDKKYQIFISSTYVDLIEQREAVVKNILRMGHLPVGMEMFNAADDSQWEVIKRHIDNSDYYLLIIARRYGSIDDDGIGFTEKEYSYALEQGIPCIAFMLNDSVKNWNNDFIDAGTPKKKLSAFKARFNKKLVNFWDSTDNLALQVSHSLSTLINIKPRMGWVRGSEVASPLIAEEISRLSKENNELKQLVAASSLANNPIQQAYNILEEKIFEFDFFGSKFGDSYLNLFHASRRVLLKGTSVHLLYMQLFAAFTKREMYEINQLPDKKIADTNKKIYNDFIDRITILRLVDQTYDNNSQSPALNLTDKGKELILKIEHPN